MAKKKVKPEVEKTEVEILEEDAPDTQYLLGSQVTFKNFPAFIAQVNDDNTYDLFVLRENSQYVRNVAKDAIG